MNKLGQSWTDGVKTVPILLKRKVENQNQMRTALGIDHPPVWWFAYTCLLESITVTPS